MNRKVTTFDGKVFTIPEENIESFLDEYNAVNNFGGNSDIISKMRPANQVLRDIGMMNRGAGGYGLMRNILKGLGGARAEAFIRSGGKVSGEEYKKYKRNAIESAEGFERLHPTTATIANITGQIIPTIGAIGLTSLTGGGAAPTAVAQGSRLASLAKMLATPMAAGAASGALSGFMNDPREDIGLRLNSAGSGALGGAVGGALALGGGLALGGARKGISRIIRGLGDNPISENKISESILRDVVEEIGKSGAAGKQNANILFAAAQRGDRGILDAATNLENKILGMRAMREPGLVELAPNPRWTAQTPSASRIENAYKTASQKQAGMDFEEFVANQPNKTGAGLAMNEYFKKNPIAASIVKANKRRVGEELTTYEGLQKVEDVLRRNLPKNFDSGRAVNRSAKIEDALDDLSDLREVLFPGQKMIDAEYAAAMNAVQLPAQKAADSYVSQIARGIAQTMNPEISLTGASRLAFTPYVRGRARELIEGITPNYNLSKSVQNVLNTLGISYSNMLNTQ